MRERKSHKLAAAFWWLLAAGWIAVLFYLAEQSGEESSRLSGWLANAIYRQLPFLNMSLLAFEAFLRKLAHFGIFAVEGFLIRTALYATKPRGWRNTLFALLLCAPLAVTNELAQLAAAGRACAAGDMLIDMAGAVCGILFAALLTWNYENFSRRRQMGDYN